MNLKAVFTSAFILLIISSAHAFRPRGHKNCQDLNPEMSNWFQEAYENPKHRTKAPIEKVLGPVIDQKVGWCFAYTAADMLSEASGHRISGAHVAKNYYNRSPVGMIRTFLRDNKEGGHVRESLEINLERPLCEDRMLPSRIYNSYSKVKNTSCEHPITEVHGYRTKSFKATGFYDGHTLFRNLDDILNDGRIAGIEYDQAQLTEDKTRVDTQTKADHASSIVARYFDRSDLSCRYIIRNSFGRTCKKGTAKRTKCIDGYYSVTEAQLNQMLIEVISLELAK